MNTGKPFTEEFAHNIMSKIRLGVVSIEDVVSLLNERAMDFYKESKWIGIKDGLPETKNKYASICVAIYDPNSSLNNGVHGCYYNQREKFHTDEGLPYKPTHWCLLPEPPKI